ncbi:hypothetical protein [Sphingomicrobium lutaoense]|uniref:ABC transporter n=1 Tax=Sphingomicrobium lutaoense TaxID=515949 RepID=A0A839YZE8_9SPHN|nr:hypothetical protein [Sphingomicrobium lutaoense]MBB3764366.1 hypothetical protein [Sphingomicrobium lutaoense]
MMRRAMTLLAALALGACASEGNGESPPPAEAGQPPLAMLTSLPLMFGEEFSIEGAGSPALSALQSEWQVQAVATTDARELAPHDLLLMAHAPVQTAEGLVDLDAWVRGGGRLLLLADPRLDWPSDLPMGDRRRPIPFFADTGLLGHWGLVLHGPIADGPVSVDVEGRDVMTSSPGRFAATGEACALRANGFIATCALGKGQVTLIADADFLRAERQGDAGLAFLLSELAQLSAR